MTSNRRQAARETALTAYREALRSLGELVIEFIEWQYDNAELLALEAKAMVESLTTDTHFVWFRKARIGTWRRKYRKHAARAWAKNAMLAQACRLSLDA